MKDEPKPSFNQVPLFVSHTLTSDNQEIRYVHATEAEAKAAAATQKNKGERSQGSLSFSLPGDPRLAAEGRISIALRPGIPVNWRIKRVEHRLGSQGYTCQVEAERFTATPEPITGQPL